MSWAVKARPREDRNAEGGEEIGADAVGLDAEGLVIGGAAGDVEAVAGVAVADDGDVAEGDRADAGDGGQLFFETAVEHGGLRVGVAGARWAEAEEQQMVGAEAERGVVEVGEGADEEAGADEQDGGKSDLEDDE